MLYWLHFDIELEIDERQLMQHIQVATRKEHQPRLENFVIYEFVTVMLYANGNGLNHKTIAEL